MYSSVKKSGFTLIELLVVIAIIALLVSILLPSLNKAKDLANRTVCASSEKNIAYAFNMYAEDFNGYIPPVVNRAIANLPWWRVMHTETHSDPHIGLGYIEGSLRNDPGHDATITCPGMRKALPDLKGCAWGITTGTAGDPTRMRNLHGQSWAKPAEGVLLADGDVCWYSTTWYSNIIGLEGGVWDTSATPHMGASNVMFADLHVESVSENAETHTFLDLMDEAFYSTGPQWVVN